MLRCEPFNKSKSKGVIFNVIVTAKFLKSASIAVLSLTVSGIANTAASRPNIVVVLVDDMGYSDPGYMGGEAITPNLGNLAKKGVTFLNMFNNAKCAPSRAAERCRQIHRP